LEGDNLYERAQPEWLPELDVTPPARQRRLTVLLRLLLLIPQFIVLAVLGFVTFFAAIAAWFAALALGRLPGWAQAYLSGYVAYTTRVYASLYLLVDSYPPFGFTAPGSPVQVELRPGHLNRLAVLFRIILAIPAGVIAAVLTAGWHALSFFCWLVVLILGRMPAPLFEATAAILRYSMRLQAYFLMLTAAYPKRLFGDRLAAGAYPRNAAQVGVTTAGVTQLGVDQAAADLVGVTTAGAAAVASSRGSATRPLLLTSGGRVLLAVFIIIGVLGIALPSGESSSGTSTGSTAGPAHP
jgi:hypothetical protein